MNRESIMDGFGCNEATQTIGSEELIQKEVVLLERLEEIHQRTHRIIALKDVMHDRLFGCGKGVSGESDNQQITSHEQFIIAIGKGLEEIEKSMERINKKL